MSSFRIVATAVVAACAAAACQAPSNTAFTGTSSGDIVFSGNGSTYGIVVTNGVPAPGGGVQGGTATGALVDSGTATMTGQYEVVHYLSGDDEFSTDGGDITLLADFGAATLTGSAGDLTVNGTISGLTLAGTASYAGIDGSLIGVIGAERATGYMTGLNGNSAFAGAFLVSP